MSAHVSSSAKPPCPEARRLADWLQAGEAAAPEAAAPEAAAPEAAAPAHSRALTGQDDMQHHLEGCLACQDTLLKLVEGDPTLADIAARLKTLGGGEAGPHPLHLGEGSPALDKVLAKLRAVDPHEVPAEAQLPASQSLLDILTPAPGSLGTFGPYDILAVLGHGGMGVVLKALDREQNRVVAVKLLAQHLLRDGGARQRFLREARANAACTHENVVPVLSVGEESGVPFMVLQYVDGISVQQRIDFGLPCSVDEVAAIGLQVARGLDAMHRHGVIHRDIKPGNILLEKKTHTARITDFGLARAIEGAGVTQAGAALGTPAYMSPEQAEGLPLDQRSDLFSLGSVLYTLCTGRPPFGDSQPLAVIRRVCDETPVPVRQLNPHVPAWLADLIERLHAKNPAARPASAAEVAHCLEHPEQRTPPPGRGHRARRRWLTAAVLLAAMSFGVSEAAGLTSVLDDLAVMLHVRLPEGILVVDIKDPQIKIQFDDRDLVITGAGLQEFRWKVGTYRLLASKDGKPVKDEMVTLQRNKKEVVRIAYVPVPPLVVADAPKGLPLPPPLLVLSGHQGPVHSLAVTPDGRYVLSATGWPKGDNTIRLWDLFTGKEVRRFLGHDADVNAISLSPDGTHFLSAGADETLRLWDLKSEKEVRRFEGHVKPITRAVWSADGQSAVSAGGDMTIRLWDVATGKEIRRFKGHRDRIEALALSPDGKKILSGARDGTLCLWDMRTGQELRCFDLERGWINSVSFLADGKNILIAGGNYACVWNLETATEVRRFRGAQFGVIDAVLSPDGKYLVTGSYDHGLRLYEFETAKLLYTWPDHREFVWAVAFTPDGRFFLSGGGGKGEGRGFVAGADFGIRVWELKRVLAFPR